MQKKYTRSSPTEIRECIVDVISSIAEYIIPPPSPFLERYKNAVSGCATGGGGRRWRGAINASNARAHERPEGSSRFQNARVYARSSASTGLL